MKAASRWSLSRWETPLLLLVGLGIALRLIGVAHDLPFSFYGDELHLTRRAMAMGTGDLNPHWFHKGALLLYALLAVYGAFFVVGRVVGRFASTAAFGAYYLTHPGPFLLLGRLLVALCGVAMVWLAYRLARAVLGDRLRALAAAALVAVLPPLVLGSQEIKEDVPTAALGLLAVTLELTAGDERPLRRALLAGAAGGLALAVKATAGPLLVGVVVAELWRGRAAGAWRPRLARAAAVVAAALLAWFLASPYQFLDRGYSHLLVRMGERVQGGEQHGIYEPDAMLVYQPTPRWWARSARAYADVFLARGSAGPLVTLLALAGLVALLRARATRLYGLLVLVALATFSALAIVPMAFHTAPRHLAVIFPLLCVAVVPGAELLAGWLPVALPARYALAGALVAIALATAAVLALVATRDELRADSRARAAEWILDHLPRAAPIVLDDYGPPLLPDRRALLRQQARLRAVPASAFTIHQDDRLRLLLAFPPAEGRDIEELGHQWWRAREASDDELRHDPVDLDMGNPLVSRVPLPIASYRAAGFRFVVTNSDASVPYERNAVRRAGFPSFVRFYRELARCPRVKTFDPASWDGKGPVIWIYDISRGCPPAPASASPAAAPARPSAR